MSFLSDFLYHSEGTEAPRSYFVWAGLSALSSIVSRKVWIVYGGRFIIHGNLYTVLVGPAGNGKTTALDMARDVVRAVGNIPFAAESQTKESIVLEMGLIETSFEWNGKKYVYTPYSIMVTELSHFLGFNSGPMIDFLTTIYDRSVYDAKTKNKGSFLITGPYVNLIGCTTPEWITSYLKSDIISGGFSRRAIFVNEYEGTQRISWPELRDDQKAAMARCIVEGKRKQMVRGEMTWSKEAREFWDKWYMARPLPKDPAIRGYYRTKHIQIIKVALLLSVDQSDSLVLDVSHLEAAMAMFDLAEANLPQVFQGVGRNELNAIGLKIIEFVSGSGKPMPEKEIRRIMGPLCNDNEFFAVVKNLVDTDRIIHADEKLPSGHTRRMLCTPEQWAALRSRTTGDPNLKTSVASGGSGSPPSPGPAAG